MTYLTFITITITIIIVILVYRYIYNITYIEPFTKQINSGRAEYNKHMRNFRRYMSDLTNNIKTNFNRKMRQFGF